MKCFLPWILANFDGKAIVPALQALHRRNIVSSCELSAAI
jgi:hypothetical protein